MQNINDILYQSNILDMYPKIQAYYDKHLGISVVQQTVTFYSDSPDDPNEMSFTYPHRIINARKIPILDQKKFVNSDVLDSGEVFSVLSTHFEQLLSQNKLSLTQLVEIKHHIDYQKAQHLKYDFLDDHPEGTVIVRFLDGLYFAVLRQIKQEIATGLSQPESQDSLINPFHAYLDELVTLPAQCNMEELISFQERITQLKETEKQDEDLESKITVSSIKIAKEIKRRVSTIIANVETSSPKDRIQASTEQQFLSRKEVLNEMLPTLKSQLYLKKNLAILSNNAPPEFEKILDKSIKASIFDLLVSYEKEVISSFSDRKKTQKLRMIHTLKDLCQDESDSSLLYTEIVRYGPLLKSQSIGRYLYETICLFLGIKVMPEKYSSTLFQAARDGINTFDLESDEIKKKYG